MSFGGLYGPLMGGYAGGSAVTAVVVLAHHILGVIAFRAKRHNAFPIHIHHVCNTTSEMLWLVSVSGWHLKPCAMAKNRQPLQLIFKLIGSDVVFSHQTVKAFSLHACMRGCIGHIALKLPQ